MYPVCLNISGKLCVVVGGGTVAERKVKGVLLENAQVKIVSPEITEGLFSLVKDNAVEWHRKTYTSADLMGAFLVFAATDIAAVQQEIFYDANTLGILVNVIDSPAQCSFQVPAIVRRGDLTLTVSTSGKSPAVAALVRRRLLAEYGGEYGVLLELMGRIREPVIAAAETSEQRKILFQKVLHEDIVKWIRTGRLDRVQKHLQDVLGPDLNIDICQLEQCT